MSRRVPSRLPRGHFESLLVSGELHRLAKQAESQADLARLIGMTPDAIVCARIRLSRRGVHVPSFDDLKREPGVLSDEQATRLDAAWQADAPVSAVNGNDDFQDEERTNPDAHATAHDNAPDGYHVRGVSSLYVDGQVRAQWVKTTRSEQERHAAMLEALASIADSWAHRAEPADTPAVSDDDLLAVYPLGDPHLGMYAWAQETGNSFDLEIAERNLCDAMDHLVALAPAAHEALIINLGDFFHSDSNSNQTARSGNPLDVDTRWGKVLSVGIRAMRRLIDRALEKHARVRVVCAIGNHDDHSSVFLALALSQFYEREPRVVIDTSPSKFHWHRFGANLIGVTHGDTVKARDLPGVMACDRAADWGETEHRFWYCGHVHHESVKEYPGVTVETFRTLAARDAWHHAAGYRSQRDARLDVIHRKWGRIQRHVVGINQITTGSGE